MIFFKKNVTNLLFLIIFNIDAVCFKKMIDKNQ
jgi:hypothetical protein